MSLTREQFDLPRLSVHPDKFHPILVPQDGYKRPKIRETSDGRVYIQVPWEYAVFNLPGNTDRARLEICYVDTRALCPAFEIRLVKTVLTSPEVEGEVAVYATLRVGNGPNSTWDPLFQGFVAESSYLCRMDLKGSEVGVREDWKPDLRDLGALLEGLTDSRAPSQVLTFLQTIDWPEGPEEFDWAVSLDTALHNAYPKLTREEAFRALFPEPAVGESYPPVPRAPDWVDLHRTTLKWITQARDGRALLYHLNQLLEAGLNGWAKPMEVQRVRTVLLDHVARGLDVWAEQLADSCPSRPTTLRKESSA